MNSTTTTQIDIAWTNGVLATMDPDRDDQYGLLRDHCLIVRGDTILGVEPRENLHWERFSAVIDLKGALVTPGFIDCHTHLIFGGNRSNEWEKRLAGASYSQVTAEGGGINATVRATREANFESLFASGHKRLQSMLRDGVTTVEIKSGYGLDFENEKKLLSVARALKNAEPVDIAPTLLAAHSIPTEYAGQAGNYVDTIIDRIMPELWQQGLFEAVDVFCENLAFDIEQTERLFVAAKKLGIPVKAHSEQLSNIGATRLLARYGGLSSDHLEHLDEESIQMLAKAGGVAALLPMAFYFLRDTTIPPVRLLRQYKVPMAVATDYNPGTSPFSSIRLAMNMACTLFGLTAPEAMAGVTRNAASALGRGASQGQLKAGYQANFAVWDVARPVDLFYELSWNPLLKRVFKGCAFDLP